MLDQYFCILNAVTTASKYMQTESNPDGKITVLLSVGGLSVYHVNTAWLTYGDKSYKVSLVGYPGNLVKPIYVRVSTLINTLNKGGCAGLYKAIEYKQEEMQDGDMYISESTGDVYMVHLKAVKEWSLRNLLNRYFGCKINKRIESVEKVNGGCIRNNVPIKEFLKCVKNNDVMKLVRQDHNRLLSSVN